MRLHARDAQDDEGKIMNRTMGDSTTVANIPLTYGGRPLDIAAVYRNGRYAADPAAVAKRFPAAHFVTVWIDIDGSAPESCQVLDVEQGDAGPNQAPGWVKKRASLVHTSLPTVYCDRSTYSALVAACGAAGLKPGVHYQLWISTLDGTETMAGHHLTTYAGVVAAQVEGGPAASWDRSVVYNPKWHPLP